MNGFGILIYIAIEWIGLSYVARQMALGDFFVLLAVKGFLAYLGLRFFLRRLQVPGILAASPVGIVASLLGCVLLMVPGLVSDFVGITLLLPGVRLLWLPLLMRAVTRTQMRAFGGGFQPGAGLFENLRGAGFGGLDPRAQEQNPPRGEERSVPNVGEGRVVDAEFRVLDDEEPKSS